MSPRSRDDNLAITVPNEDELLFSSILDKNLDQFAKSGTNGKKFRSASLVKALGDVEPKRHYNCRRVSFGSVSTREFERIIGDNPCCRSGPPLGIGWQYNECEDITIDSHQLKRVKRQSIVGKTIHPVTKSERRSILKWDWCYTEEEMLEAEDEIIRVQWQRHATNTGSRVLENAKEITASAGRKFRAIGKSLRRTNQ